MSSSDHKDDNVISLFNKNNNTQSRPEEPPAPGEPVPDMVGMAQAMINRICAEITEAEAKGMNQAFIIFKQEGTNKGFVFTSYNFRGPDLLGTLEATKQLAFNVYFDGHE